MRRVLLALALALAPAFAAPAAEAHVTVVPGAGDSPENATALGLPPARVFDTLPAPGGYHYYRVALEAGESVRVRLVAGEGFAASVPPWLLFVSPALDDTGFRPQNLTLPPDPHVVGYAAHASAPLAADPRYPARWATLVDRPLAPPVTGEYFVVVYSQEGGGPYALLVEREGGSPILDRYLVVTQRLDVYAWSGEPLFASLAAHAAGAVPALAVLAWGWRKGERYAELPKGGAAVAGVFLAASAGSMAWETARVAPESWAAWGLALAGAFLAAAAVALATRPGAPTIRQRVLLGLVGAAGLVAYAGILIGPVAALVTCMLPEEKKRK